MSPAHAAAVGDVLIRAAGGGAGRWYTLSAIPGPDQVSFRSMAEASRNALAFARSAGVDVWVERDASSADLLATFRVVGATGPARGSQARPVQERTLQWPRGTDQVGARLARPGA